MVHPQAVYLHEGQQYYVQELDLQAGKADLVPVALDYITEPLRETVIQVVSRVDQQEVPGGEKTWGELQVSMRVAGFRRRSWLGGENLGEEPLELPSRELQTTGYWISIAAEAVEALSREGLWTNIPNDYGPGWAGIRAQVRSRDGFRCQVCGRPEADGSGEGGREHDVHHKVPFRSFRDDQGGIDRVRANRLDNLVTLCPECHHKVESNVRIRSGMAGLGFVLSQLAPLFLMCDPGDLGLHLEPQASSAFPRPTIVLYDMVPAGIGFSQKLFELHAGLLAQALELVAACPCEDGCPSCVGPGGENGMGGKRETIEILKMLTACSGRAARPDLQVQA
jgi:DEAD/DEAH box helicase domain-containing protein